jgi:hypothetical protein
MSARCAGTGAAKEGLARRRIENVLSDTRPEPRAIAMTRIFRSLIAASLMALALPVYALDSNAAANGLPSASVFSAKLLPDRQGLVSWKTLASVEPVKQGSTMVPRFTKEILDLDKRRVQVQGFILALDLGVEQKHFLITAVPPHCQYCLPAGPDAIIEVFAKKPVRYGIEPIIVGGKLAVLRNDPSGVLYRLTEAEVVEMAVK